MKNTELGYQLVVVHMHRMNSMSKKKWPKIIELEGYEIIQDRAYQGFDNAPNLGYPQPRFWCRNITVRRISDGEVRWSIGPQREAYNQAIANFERN